MDFNKLFKAALIFWSAFWIITLSTAVLIWLLYLLV